MPEREISYQWLVLVENMFGFLTQIFAISCADFEAAYNEAK